MSNLSNQTADQESSHTSCAAGTSEIGDVHRSATSKVVADALKNDSERTSAAESSIFAGTAKGVEGSASNYEENVILRASRGHGFAAEKANHLRDKISGKDAQLVGGDNAKNGADRIVDGQQIQTKYCSSGSKCIAEAFEDGTFRYMKADGTPMQIEVPSDMYDSAVQAMKVRIEKGQVPSVSDPMAAEDLVRKGHYTYNQARNIAKFGTIESLTYDAVNGIELAGTAMGITAAISFARATWQGAPFGKALNEACFDGFCVGGVTWASSILVAQLGRTSLESSLRTGTDWVVKQMGPKVTAALANAFRDGKNIYGAAANNHVSKLLRGNVTTVSVVAAVMSIDDLGNLFTGEISGKQAFKNVSQTVSGVAGGAVGGWGGAAIGTSILPGPGTLIGGIVGSYYGGSGASAASGKVLNACIDDDSKHVAKLIEQTFAELANDYLLTEEEAKVVIAEFKVLDITKLMRSIQASKNKKDYTVKVLMPFIEEMVFYRKRVVLPTDGEFAAATSDLIDRLSEEDGGGFSSTTPDVATEQSEGDKNTSATDVQPDISLKPVRSLKEIICAYAHVLNDNNDVYCGEALKSRKGRNKLEKARRSFADGATSDAIVLVDSTLFGSVSDGLYITDTHIFGKEAYKEKMAVDMNEIRNIRMGDRSLIINQKSIGWLGDETTPKIVIIAKCICRYLAQFRNVQGTGVSLL